MPPGTHTSTSSSPAVLGLPRLQLLSPHHNSLKSPSRLPLPVGICRTYRTAWFVRYHIRVGPSILPPFQHCFEVRHLQLSRLELDDSQRVPPLHPSAP